MKAVHAQDFTKFVFVKKISSLISILSFATNVFGISSENTFFNFRGMRKNFFFFLYVLSGIFIS